MRSHLLSLSLAMNCATAPIATRAEPCEDLPQPDVAEEALLALSAFGIPCEASLVRLGERKESEFGTMWTAWCQDAEWVCVEERPRERSGLVLPLARSHCGTGLRSRTLDEIGLHCTRL